MKKVILTVLVVLLLAIGAVISIAYILDISKEVRPIQPHEKKLLFTAEKLQDMGIADIYPETCEEFIVSEEFDRTLNFEYEYSFDKDTNSRVLNISSMTEINRSSKDAVQSFYAFKVGMKIGFVKRDISLKKVDWSVPSVDKQECYLLLNSDEEQVGNLMIIQTGKAFITITLAGLYFGEEDLFLRKVTPVITEVQNYLESSHE